MTEVATVFGGSGFVGRYTVRALAKAGYRVRVAVRRPNLAAYVTMAGQPGQIELRKVNVRDAGEVEAALQGASVAVNLVGVLAPSGAQSFAAIHVDAAQTIAKAAKAHGCRRMIHISAIGAEGASDSAYASSKGTGEEKVRAAFPGATILRPSIVFGPEDDFFNRFAGMPFALPLIGGGATRFQPVFVGDVADAVVACLNNPDTEGQVYELGGPEVYSFKALLELILRVTRRRKPLMPISFATASLIGAFAQFMPKPMLTPDQVKLLKKDNVVAPGAKGLADLGITPESVEAIVPTYLWRFRPHGQYELGFKRRLSPQAGRAAK